MLSSVFTAYFRLLQQLRRRKQDPVQFNNNSASRDGLYGGLLDRCRMISVNTDDLISYNFLRYFTVQMVHNNNTAISSQPNSISFCDQNGAHDFSISIRWNQKITMSIIALAQGGIGVATEVTAILKSTARLKWGQNRQTLSNECTILTYNIYSSMQRY